MLVRPAAVANAFYPGDPEELARTVDGLLAEAREQLPSRLRSPKALIVPHAGYVFSGSTAALGYALLERASTPIQRVVLLGPTHRIAVDGLAESGAMAFETPLGRVPVEPIDPAVRARLPQLLEHPDTHAMEHSLEVHLPFLQAMLSEFVVVPLAVGRATPSQVADVLEALWGGPETLVVVSSDLSHYHPYEEARALDEVTVDLVLRLDGPIDYWQACGASPVNGLLLVAQRRGLSRRLLGMCNSGDTAGDKGRVVGYAAISFVEPEVD